MGTELKDTFVQAYNDTYDYINRYLTSKLPTRDLIEDALQSVYLDYYRSLITTEGKIKNVRHYVLRIASIMLQTITDNSLKPHSRISPT